MEIKTGHFETQPSGYKAFVPLSFPPLPAITLSSAVELKHVEVIDRFVQLNILIPRYPDRVYGKVYAYRYYLQLGRVLIIARSFSL